MTAHLSLVARTNAPGRLPAGIGWLRYFDGDQHGISSLALFSGSFIPVPRSKHQWSLVTVIVNSLFLQKNNSRSSSSSSWIEIYFELGCVNRNVAEGNDLKVTNWETTATSTVDTIIVLWNMNFLSMEEGENHDTTNCLEEFLNRCKLTKNLWRITEFYCHFCGDQPSVYLPFTH